jgi:hypothetical protein
MPKISLEIAHTLTLDQATDRLQNRFAAALTEHGNHLTNFRQEWTDHTLSFSFHVMGMGVSGSVAVDPQNVKLKADLPLAAALFKGTIEQQLRHEISAVLTPDPASMA